MSTKKHLFVNEQTESFPESGKLGEILQKKGLFAKEGIAVAVNKEIIPRERWDKHDLQENDKIIIVGASYGG